MHKEILVNNIINHLEIELAKAVDAAEKAHLAATDDQSVAETQYDTLAIEASYLAEGQSRRIIEFKNALIAYQPLLASVSDDNKKHGHENAITLGNLVQLDNDVSEQHWFYIGPAAAGYRTKINDQHFTVVTPQSPMGQALIGKYPDDEIKIQLGKGLLTDIISEVC